MVRPEKRCEHCGRPFIPDSRGRMPKFCSDGHRFKARKERDRKARPQVIDPLELMRQGSSGTKRWTVS